MRGPPDPPVRYGAPKDARSREKHVQFLLGEIGARNDVALRLERSERRGASRTYRIRLHLDDRFSVLITDWLRPIKMLYFVRGMSSGAGLAEFVAAERKKRSWR